jgi:hypothetical protein
MVELELLLVRDGGSSHHGGSKKERGCTWLIFGHTLLLALTITFSAAASVTYN